MSRLPTPDGDSGVWGSILNDFLQVAHNSDGTLQNTGIIASKADDTTVVHLAANETITGTKTFSVSPVVPTPSSSTQIANKSYVDSLSVTPASNVVGSQTYGQTSVTGTSANYARADHVHGTPFQPSAPTAEDQNLIAWTYDPLQAISFTSTSPGTLALLRIIIRKPQTLTNVIYAVTAGGTGLTVGENSVGLYTFAGNLVAHTADQTTEMSGVGIITAAWSTPYAASAGEYWVAILNNGSSTPSYARMGATALSDLASVGLTAATRRFGSYGSGLTALPATITPASIGAVTNGLFWAAIS